MQSDKTLQAQTDGRSVWLDWMRVALMAIAWVLLFRKVGKYIIG